VDSAGWEPGAYPLDRIGQHLYVDQGGATSSAILTRYVEDLRRAYLAYEGSESRKGIEITEIGWWADPSATDFATQQAHQAANLKVAYDTFSNMPYVSRAYWFNVQDIPEANLFRGQVDGGNDWSLGTPKYPVFSAFQRYAR